MVAIGRVHREFAVVARRQFENRQRKLGRQCSQVDQHQRYPEGIPNLGCISGFDIEVAQLYRLDIDLALTLPGVIGGPGASRQPGPGPASRGPEPAAGAELEPADTKKTA